ncbi:DMT family transporter [soil metagenome]
MLNNPKQIYYASLLAALSGVLYGFLGYFGTLVLQDNISVSTMLFWRFAIAGIWIFSFSIKKHAFKQMFRIDKLHLIMIFILGAIGYAGSSVFYFLASQYTGTGLAMVVFFSYPIAVGFMSWVADKNIFNISIVLMLITMLIGMFLLQDFSSKAFNMIGVLFGILAGICYAIYIIGSKRFSTIAVNSNIVTLMVCFSCTFVFLTLSVLTHTISFPHSLKTWLYVLALGVFATALPIQLLFKSLKHISAMRASIISVLEPLVTVLVGIVALNESVSLLQTLGAFMILSSVILILKTAV